MKEINRDVSDLESVKVNVTLYKKLKFYKTMVVMNRLYVNKTWRMARVRSRIYTVKMRSLRSMTRERRCNLYFLSQHILLIMQIY